MKFDKALELMKQGYKVKLPSWGGYWCWDNEKQTIMMHCRKEDSDTGKPVLDIRETQRVEYTLSNILSEEWTIADEQNTPILGGMNYFSFGEALKYLERGFKVTRKEWTHNDYFRYVVLINPYQNDLFKVTETPNMIGTLSDCIYLKTSYEDLTPWIPSHNDMLINDWMFYED